MRRFLVGILISWGIMLMPVILIQTTSTVPPWWLIVILGAVSGLLGQILVDHYIED